MTVMEVEPFVKLACDIAAERVPTPTDDLPALVVGAQKDLNCKGKGEHWFRMVWRDGAWVYVSPDRLPSGSFRAAERRAKVWGNVYNGEVTITHDIGKGVDSTGRLECVGVDGTYLSDTDGVNVEVRVAITRNGSLKLTLPDGSVILRPNPRAGK